MHQNEKNCQNISVGHIFANENKTLTKQLKGTFYLPNNKVGVGPKRFPKFECKEFFVLAILAVIFSVSFVMVAIMWWTSSFDNYILSHLVLVNNSAAFLRWKDPPLKTLIKIHIFNYTNVEEYHSGLEDKLRVEDVGPFVYEETTHRVNVQVHPNSSITYQDFHNHVFRSDLSQNRKEADRVIVPNLSMLGAAAVTKDYFYVTRLAVSALMRGLNSRPFLSLPAYKFIWGYDDNLFDLAKTVLSFNKKLPFEKFGIMAARNGTSGDSMTILSGLADFDQIGQIERINGENRLSHWGSDSCNRIEGSDGAFYPVKDVRAKKPVNIYFREICRRIPLDFKEEVRLFGGQVAAYRYGTADTIFARPEVEPNNRCYCDGGTCAPRGLFNMSKCAFGAPAMISFPHFYKADPTLQSGVEGLSPDPERHSSYLDLHPKFGFPMGGQFRIQLNVQVKRSLGMSQLDMFEDDKYLPFIWVEAGIEPDDLPPVLKDTILTTSSTLPMVEKTLRYGFAVLSVATLAGIGFLLRRKCQNV